MISRMGRPRNALNVTEAERERIRELYRQGLRLTEICLRTGRCDSVVSRAVRGMTRPKPVSRSAKIARRNVLIVSPSRESQPRSPVKPLDEVIGPYPVLSENYTEPSCEEVRI